MIHFSMTNNWINIFINIWHFQRECTFGCASCNFDDKFSRSHLVKIVQVYFFFRVIANLIQMWKICLSIRGKNLKDSSRWKKVSRKRNETNRDQSNKLLAWCVENKSIKGWPVWLYQSYPSGQIHWLYWAVVISATMQGDIRDCTSTCAGLQKPPYLSGHSK